MGRNPEARVRSRRVQSTLGVRLPRSIKLRWLAPIDSSRANSSFVRPCAVLQQYVSLDRNPWAPGILTNAVTRPTLFSPVRTPLLTSLLSLDFFAWQRPTDHSSDMLRDLSCGKPYFSILLSVRLQSRVKCNPKILLLNKLRSLDESRRRSIATKLVRAIEIPHNEFLHGRSEQPHVVLPACSSGKVHVL